MFLINLNYVGKTRGNKRIQEIISQIDELEKKKKELIKKRDQEKREQNDN